MRNFIVGRTAAARNEDCPQDFCVSHVYYCGQAQTNAELHSDLAWWHVFLQSWNGLSLLHSLHTDASGSWS